MAAFANFEWPDATVTPEPVIPSGETVEVTDASVIDAYTSVTIESGATLQLATDTPPTTTLKGSGTIEKTGSQVWNMTKAQTEFSGSYYLKAGVVTNAVIGGYSKDWRTTITVDGTNAHYRASSTYHVGWSDGGGGRFYVNMNAGLFESSAIARREAITTRVR